MRAYLPAYEMRAPADVKEALQMLDAEPGVWKPFAGGTDLMVVFETGKLAHKKYLSLWHLEELRGIDVADDHISIGALTTYAQIQSRPLMHNEFPMLCQAASETGAIAIQNRGTIGGNICNASPAADSPPALLVYDAEVELISRSGTRRVAYEKFHQSYKQIDLKQDELLSRIILPRPEKPKAWVHHYRKVGTRRAQAISKVCFAGLAKMHSGTVEDVRLALGSVAPTPYRCVKTEAVLKGKPLTPALVAAARRELAHEINPIDDIRSNAAFRVRVSQNVLEEFLSRCGIGSVN